MPLPLFKLTHEVIHRLDYLFYHLFASILSICLYTTKNIQTNGTNHTINKMIKSKKIPNGTLRISTQLLRDRQELKHTNYFFNWIIQSISFIWTLLFHLLVIVFKCRMPENQQITLKRWAEKYKRNKVECRTLEWHLYQFSFLIATQLLFQRKIQLVG